jgi:hypothetical protein
MIHEKSLSDAKRKKAGMILSAFTSILDKRYAVKRYVPGPVGSRFFAAI